MNLASEEIAIDSKRPRKAIHVVYFQLFKTNLHSSGIDITPALRRKT